MSWLQTQVVMLDAATAAVEFAANWLLQSSLLIAIGLTVGTLLARRGSAVQSAVYRTTLLAVLVCPLAGWALWMSGVSGWSLAVPRPWTYEPAPLVAKAVLSVAPAAADEPVAADAMAPALAIEEHFAAEQPISLSETPPPGGAPR